MTKTAIEESVRNFLINEVFYDKALDVNALGPADSLVGMLDSLGIMRVVSFCEETFGIQVPDTEILPEHFENISAIASLIEVCQKS
ncbi:MAG: acyl carrier protein [Candidatus Binataceae bacterium]